MLTLDYETRSQVSIKDLSSWAYSRHPSTEVMVLGWNDGRGFRGRWIQGDPPPMGLFNYVLDNKPFAAHNATFEAYIWENVCQARMGWPAVLPDQWNCTAAKAAAMSLPRDLGRAGEALKLDKIKDSEGKAAMMRLSRPRKPTKKDPSIWNEDPVAFEEMLAYNDSDVESEMALADATRPLTEFERKVYLATERLNRRGVAVDVEGAEAAVKIAEEWVGSLLKEFAGLTGGLEPTQRVGILKWLREVGWPMDNTQAKTVDDELKKPNVPQNVRRMLEIMRSAGKTSVAKYRKMRAMADTDGRLRGMFLYCGADRTGRWSARGVQPHNFPRGREKNMEQAWELIRTGDPGALSLFADPMDFLSSALRGALWAPEGRELVTADYAAIECRATFWMAGEQQGLDVFLRGEDIYCDMAATIYNYLVTKKMTLERFLGKQAVLGLGFGMGFVKFLIHCRSFGVRFSMDQIKSIVPAGSLNALAKWVWEKNWGWVSRSIEGACRADVPELVLMKWVVDKYRARFTKVVAMWSAMEDCFRRALQNPGKVYAACRTSWCFGTFAGVPYMLCKLPSGRLMHYPYPAYGPKPHDVNGEESEELSYMGVNDKNQWVRISTYGGKLTENVVQATARDLMAHSLLAVEAHPKYKDIVLTVHDELVSECDEGTADVEEYCKLVASTPKWAAGLPVACEGWKGRRYRK